MRVLDLIHALRQLDPWAPVVLYQRDTTGELRVNGLRPEDVQALPLVAWVQGDETQLELWEPLPRDDEPFMAVVLGAQ